MYLTTLYGVIGDDYYAHQVVKSIFPEKVLFQKRESTVIALSDNPPVKECFDKKVKIGKEKKIDLETFEEGEELFFTLVVNPTKRIKGKRVAVTNFNDWFHKKLEGIEVTTKEFRDLGVVKNKNGSLSHRLYQVSGSLKIKSKEKFLEILCRGVGSSKGFGFGMLNVF
jgi:CRISPR-associated protein Cas6/Cse3/CasE subtype I-E